MSLSNMKKLLHFTLIKLAPYKNACFLFLLVLPFMRLSNHIFFLIEPLHLYFYLILICFVLDWLICSIHMVYIYYIGFIIYFYTERFWVYSFMFLISNSWFLWIFSYLNALLFFHNYAYILFYTFLLFFCLFFFKIFFSFSVISYENYVYFNKNIIGLLVYSNLRKEINISFKYSKDLFFFRFGIFLKKDKRFLDCKLFNFQKKSIFFNKECFSKILYLSRKKYYFLFFIFSINLSFGFIGLRCLF